MDGIRRALIVASDQYADPRLRRLRAPASDARSLAMVLQDPQIGGFEVRTLLNEPAHVVNLAVEEFFADRRPGDLLLVHFSGHGIKDEDGELYFAASNTVLGRLGATAVAAEFVSRRMTRSRSRRVVLLLDCCYAGAFERGLVVRAGAELGIEQQFGGRGRAVITASSAMEYAFEGGELADTGEAAPSVFTSALVEGLASGEADRDQDGLVGLDELYDYVYDKVRAVTPNQTPGKWTFGVEGELYIARRARPVTVPAVLPPELQHAIDSPLAGIRVGAVQELAGVLSGRHAGMALAARLALEQLTDDDSRTVAAAAAAALGGRAAPKLELSATAIDLGRLLVRGQSPERLVRIRNVGGGDLHARVTSSAGWLKLRQAGDELVVAADTSTAGQYEGTVIVDSDGGTAAIRVRAVVSPAPLPASETATTTKPEPVPETPSGAASYPQQDLTRVITAFAAADAPADRPANAANAGGTRLDAGEVDSAGVVARVVQVIASAGQRLRSILYQTFRSHRPRPERATRAWFRRPIVTTSLVVLLFVVIGGGYIAWRWTQNQYYVGADGNGQVLIYRGVNQRVLGVSLSRPYQQTGIRLTQIPAPYQQTVKAADAASSLSNAQAIVANIHSVVTTCQQQYTALREWVIAENAYQTAVAQARQQHKSANGIPKPGPQPTRPSAMCPPSTAFGIAASALVPAAT